MNNGGRRQNIHGEKNPRRRRFFPTQKIIEDAKAKPKRYGMRINLLDSNPATRVKYLYDAVGMTHRRNEFRRRRVRLWRLGRYLVRKKNRPVMVRTDGTVDYELNHENHALKLNGGASDITKTSYGGNAMSEIPLIWVKRWTQNNYHFVVFCEEQYDDTYKAYAHTDADGNVLPVTYFPMYEGFGCQQQDAFTLRSHTDSVHDRRAGDDRKESRTVTDGINSHFLKSTSCMKCTMITCKDQLTRQVWKLKQSVRQSLADRNTQRKRTVFSVIHRPQAVIKVFYRENFPLRTTGNV